MIRRKPELLAPAGDMRSLIAAVENGADAVYLGINNFSARAYAGNFTIDEFREALDYAHLRGVRVYVTLNTLIKDTEIEKIAKLMKTLDKLGTDAIIVQDIGLLSLAGKLVPELPLHASTQMTIHNSEGVRFLHDMGVKRVVLAREMALSEIKEIIQNTDMEIETFVHGALCICYSGQCLMSSMIGGRSGNRGYCAQPCRKKYDLYRKGKKESTAGKFLLSPRDLNSSDILPELIEAGIGSFKIEGRMKRPEYVAGVVRIYRRLIDRYMEKPEQYIVSEEERLQLEQLFNREFTTGYFKGNPGNALMSRERPYNRGVRIGKVRGFDNKHKNLLLELSGELRAGDGIGFEAEQESGNIVRQMYKKGKPVKEAGKGDIIRVSSDIQHNKGTSVYKTLDISLMKELEQSFESTGLRKVSVFMKARAFSGEKLELMVRDEDDNIVHISSEYVVETAIKKATNEKDIRKQFTKLGNTVFDAKDMEISMEEGIFIPIKEMNELRNRAVAELEKMRIDHRRKSEHKPCRVSEKPAPENINQKPLLAVSIIDPESVETAVSSGADLIYYERKSSVHDDESDLRIAAAHAKEVNVPIYLHTPVIVKDSQMPEIEKIMNAAKESGFAGILASNPGIFKKATEHGIPVIVDTNMNIFNRESAALFIKKGAISVVLSPEMNYEQIIEASSSAPTELIVQGSLRVMVSEHGLVTNLTGPEEMSDPDCRVFELMDKKGFAFPVRTDCSGRTHIFNSKELCLLEDMTRLIQSGVSRFRIDARMTDSSHIKNIVSSYRKTIDSYFSTEENHVIADKCRDISKEYTRGHFHRGVL
jgi:putative protease